jgi:hypothetical protein
MVVASIYKNNNNYLEKYDALVAHKQASSIELIALQTI